MGWTRGKRNSVKWSQRNFVGVFLAALAAPLSLWTVAFLLYASNARGLRGDSGGAADGQRRGVGGAETTGSLRAFSRGTPRMIALKEEAWYRALTLLTFRAFECVVPIMRDRVKNSPRPDRSRLPP